MELPIGPARLSISSTKDIKSCGRKFVSLKVVSAHETAAVSV